MFIFYQFPVFVCTDGGTETDSKSQSPEAAMSQHVLVCALHELGCLIQSLGTSASSLVSEPSAGKTVN